MNRYRLAQIIDDVSMTQAAGDTRPYALRIADAVLTAAAVVELPTPNEQGDFDTVRVWTPPSGATNAVLGRLCFESEWARTIAAELLAAADSADRIDAKGDQS